MRIYVVYIILFLNTLPCITAAQPSFTINLDVEDTSDYVIYHNEPVVFSVTIVNDSLWLARQWNTAADEWLAKLTADYKAGVITKAEYEKKTLLAIRGKRTMKADTIGSAQYPWFQQMQIRAYMKNLPSSVSLPIEILGDKPTNPVALLNDTAYYLLELHLGPEKVSKLQPGIYTIKIFLAGIWSNPVTVKVRQEDIPAKIFKSRDMQLRLGNYYLETKDDNKAFTYANEVLEKNPVDIGGLVLRGKSYILKKKYKRALEDFEMALKQHLKQNRTFNEPPVYFYATISWLKKKL